MDNNTQQQIKSTEEYFSEFYFIVFSPNPNKENVRVIIDDGSIKMYLKIKKFVDIIEKTMNSDTARKVKNCCDIYGGFFLIDRIEGTIEKLQSSEVDKKLDLAQLHKDVRKDYEEQTKSDDYELRKQYLQSLNKTLEKEMFSGSRNANRFSSTIIYGQQGIRKYRP